MINRLSGAERRLYLDQSGSEGKNLSAVISTLAGGRRKKERLMACADWGGKQS